MAYEIVSLLVYSFTFLLKTLVNHNLHSLLTYPCKDNGAGHCGERDGAACGFDGAEGDAFGRVERHLLVVAKAGDGDVACGSSDSDAAQGYAVDARGIKSLDCSESTPWIGRLVCADCCCRNVECGVCDGYVFKHIS